LYRNTMSHGNDIRIENGSGEIIEI
jgi:hypothetical protein